MTLKSTIVLTPPNPHRYFQSWSTGFPRIDGRRLWITYISTIRRLLRMQILEGISGTQFCVILNRFDVHRDVKYLSRGVYVDI